MSRIPNVDITVPDLWEAQGAAFLPPQAEGPR